MQRAFLQNLYEHDVKFPFATLFAGRKHTNQFDFFSESELGCGRQDSIGKFTYICYFKRDERKARKFFLKKKNKQTNRQTNKQTKKHTFILIAREVFVALAVQAGMIKSGKVSDKLDKLFAQQNIAKL